MKPADRDITTPYGKKGSAWATGEHGGVDYGCPTGDPVFAMWGGSITGASWGSAYGTQLVIDHDHLPNGDPGLWAVYAHLKSKVRTSGRVAAGELIGYSGATGNVSGPHLHVEVQYAANWKSGNYTNPQPWIDAAGGDDMGDAWDYYFSGKPSGTFTVGTSYKELDCSDWNPAHAGVEFAMVYLNVAPVFASGHTMGSLRIRAIRADGDASAYHDYLIASDALEDGTQLITHVYFEKGDGGKTHYEVRCQGGLQSATIGTRYRKGAVDY